MSASCGHCLEPAATLPHAGVTVATMAATHGGRGGGLRGILGLRGVLGLRDVLGLRGVLGLRFSPGLG